MTELRTKGDPIAVHYDTVTSALELLGIDVRDVQRVVIEPHAITVRRAQRDVDDRLVSAGDEVVTTTTVIAIRRDEAGSAVIA